jgi:hypothetical protein
VRQLKEAVTDPGGHQGGWVFVISTVAIGAWMAHLTAESALTRFTCTRHSTRWVLHLLTIALGVVALAATLAGWRLAHAGGQEDEEAASREATARFLGMFATIVAASNLLLILAEGGYVVFLRSCA